MSKLKTEYKKIFCKKCEKVTQHKLIVFFEDKTLKKFKAKCLSFNCKTETTFIQYKMTKYIKK